MALAVGTAVFATVITSSPGPMSRASSATIKASVPLATPTALPAAEGFGHQAFEAFHLGAENQDARAQRLSTAPSISSWISASSVR